MMAHTFPELVIGGVLVAPFVTYAITAAVIFLALRPVLRLAALGRAFAHPPAVALGLYVLILAALIVLF